MELLARFHERVSSRIDRPELIITDIEDGLREILDVDMAVVVVADPSAGEVLARRGGDEQLMSAPSEDILDVLEQRWGDSENAGILHDATEDILVPDGAGPAAVVPIRFDQRLAGALIVANHEDSEPVGERELALLEVMAPIAGVVLGYSMRLRSEEKQRILADTLREVTAAMASTLDLRGVLDGVLKGLDRVLPFDTATLMLRQDDDTRVMASRGFDSPRQILNVPLDLAADPVLGELVATSDPKIIEDWPAHLVRPFYVSEATRSFIAVPLVARNRVIGVFTVGHTEPSAYTLEEALIVDAFADHAAVAIQNARLFKRTQASLAKSETLYRVAQSLIVGSTLAETLQIVVDGVAEALPADRVSLITMNPGQETVIHFVRGGPGRDRIVAVNFDELWEGLAGHVMRTKQPLISDGQSSDDREGPRARVRREATEAGPIMVAPLRYRGKLFGVLTAINRRDQPAFGAGDLNLLVAMANQAAMSIENARLFDEVQRLAVTDELTGLSNRRGFFDLAGRELDRAVRTGRPVTALMLDIDGFKKVNDTYGHAVGDEVLRELARRSREAVRDVDLVGRYGGEEFCYLLPEAEPEVALQVAERISSAISDRPIETAGGPLEIKVSIGVAYAVGTRDETVANLLDRADTAMYEAKEAGGDMVTVESNAA